MRLHRRNVATTWTGLVICAAGMLGCQREAPTAAPPIVIDARDKPAATGAAEGRDAGAAGVRDAAARDAAVARDAAAEHPERCEVEMFGSVKPPPGKKIPIYVYVSDGDCLADGAHILGRAQVSENNHNFFVEVFSRWAADLTVCAAAQERPDRPSKLYVKASGKYHAEATGEIGFTHIDMELKPGPAHKFAAPTP